MTGGVTMIITMTIRARLFAFAGLAVFFMLSIMGILTYFYVYKIEKAGQLKNSGFKAIEKMKDVRIAEKRYLQFFSDETRSDLEKELGAVREEINGFAAEPVSARCTELLNTITAGMNHYSALLEAYATIHRGLAGVEKAMVEPLRTAEAMLSSVQQDLEARQSQMQMDGGKLSSDELEMMNVVRDCKIVIFQLQIVQQQFLASGDQKYLKQFEETLAGGAASSIDALGQFSKSLNNESFNRAFQQIRMAIDDFQVKAKKSQEFSEKDREQIKLLDNAGKETIQTAKTFLQELDNAVQQSKGSAITAIVLIVILGLLSFIALSIYIARGISTPIRKALELANSIRLGDVTQRLVFHSKDEMGQLSQYLNNMVESLQ